MPVYIALLRGINVGGNKKLPMADLRTLCESLGFAGAQTLLQSGNVVFASPRADAEGIVRDLEAGIAARFGFESRVLLRARDQWAALIARHPFTPEQIAEPSKILVTFLLTAPDAAAIAALRAAHAGPEQVEVRGQEVYAYYPDGMGRSKLDNSFVERKLKTVGTGRNWNTVIKLLAEAAG
ncbi:MAG: DUF1697 domain-containing protein [Anaerolineae bacterium]|nr:DUF1697 domain-containing protein [Anaerolineae bacterium]